MKTSGVLAILLALFSICSIAYAADISGGKSVVVIGTGRDGSDGQAPELDLSGTRPTVGTFDPSELKSWKTNFTIPPIPSDGQGNLSDGQVQQFLFVSISTVTGAGDFSAWRSLGDLAGVKLKQTSSGRGGNLESDNRVLLTNEGLITSPESNKSIVAISRDAVRFSGVTYRDNEYYKNDADRISNSFDVSGISKESLFVGQLDYTVYDDQTIFNRSISYDHETEYIGSSSFNSKIGSGNGSYISEDYLGAFSLTRRMYNNELFNETKLTENWMSWDDLYSEWTTGKKFLRMEDG